jgi:hypothetical protein
MYRHAARTPDNSYEKGIPVDQRGMPYLLPGTVEPAGQKYVDRNRRKIEEARTMRRQTNSLDGL